MPTGTPTAVASKGEGAEEEEWEARRAEGWGWGKSPCRAVCWERVRERAVSIVTGEWVTHCPAAGANVGVEVEVEVGRGEPRSTREPLPRSLETPSQWLLPVASELCCSGLNHTKALYTELLCWALLLGCSRTPTPVPAKSKASGSCWTQQGKVRGSAAKSWGALTPLECVQVGSPLSLTKTFQSGLRGENKPGPRRHQGSSTPSPS